MFIMWTDCTLSLPVY